MGSGLCLILYSCFAFSQRELITPMVSTASYMWVTHVSPLWAMDSLNQGSHWHQHMMSERNSIFIMSMSILKQKSLKRKYDIFSLVPSLKWTLQWFPITPKENVTWFTGLWVIQPLPVSPASSHTTLCLLFFASSTPPAPDLCLTHLLHTPPGHDGNFNRIHFSLPSPSSPPYPGQRGTPQGHSPQPSRQG